ncbi:hypothetical protein JCM5350_003482 [Sporobolomyces pararoseus]
MSSSESDDDDANRRNYLPLGLVNSQSFKPQTLIRGEIKNCSSYKDGVASISIADHSDILQVQLKGDWAEDAIKKLNKIGKWIVLTGKRGTAEVVKDKRGQPILRDDMSKLYRVVYSRGMKGIWGQNAKGSPFSFRPDGSKGTRYSTGSTNPHARPSSTSSSQHQRALSRLDQAEPRRMTLDQEIQEARSDSSNQRPPLKMRVSVDLELSSDQPSPFASDSTGRDGSQSSSSERSEDEDSDRPIRKKKKRDRPQTRKEWGMKTTQTKLEYLPLDILGTSKNRSNLNFIAIAILKKEIYETRNDPATDIWLYDPTHTKSPMMLGFFAKNKNHLPVFKNGDILIVQKINYTKDRNQLTAYSSLTNGRFLIIPAKDALEFTEGTSRELLARLDKCEARLAKVGEEELMYARDVARWSKRFDVVGNHVDPWGQEVEKKSAAEISRGVTKGVGNRRELVTISQLQPDTFYDVQGEIVKVYNPHGTSRYLHEDDYISLYITDYTRNDQLMSYTETSSVPLLGQYVLQISVWGHQALPITKSYENEDSLKGKFIHCRNVRAKISGGDLLEGAMWTDEKKRDRSDLTFRTENELALWYKDFSRRREIYIHSTSDAKLNDPLLTLNPQARVEATTFDNPFASSFDTLGLAKQQPMSQALSCRYPGTYLFKARVIDFKPDNLEDFVIAYCTECQEPLPKGCRTCLEHEKASHMYQFALVLEGEPVSSSDSPSRILVEVSGRDAELLFPNLTPSQIFNDPSSYLPKLSSRLSPLLGNLPKMKLRQKPSAEQQQSIKFPETDSGEWKDFVVEGWKDGNGNFRWKFNQDKTLFQ